MEVVLGRENGQGVGKSLGHSKEHSSCACQGRAHARGCGQWGAVREIEKSVLASQGIAVVAGETKHSPNKVR